MENNSRQGDKSELSIAAEMVMRGFGVSIPYGHEHQYDLIVEKDGALYKIQVKTAHHEEKNRYYIDADAEEYSTKFVDLLAGYSEDDVDSFFIPLREASGTRQRVTFTDFEDMGPDVNQQNANHISKYRFGEAIKRI